MNSFLIKNTTREQREQIVVESLENINGACDGCMPGLAEMYQDYVDGKKEIHEINMEFNVHYVSGIEVPEKGKLRDDVRVTMIIYRILQCTWGLLQTLVGAIVYSAHWKEEHYSYHGAIVTTWKRKASLSIGMFLFLTDDPFYYYPDLVNKHDEKSFSRQLLVHEYGHTIQSLLFGPLYLILVGVPSVGWSFLPIFVKKRETDRISYFSGYPERWANHLGERFTDEESIGEPV